MTAVSEMNSFSADSASMREISAKLAAAKGGGWMIALAEVLGKMADNMAKSIVDMARAVDDAGPEAPNISELNAKLNAATQVLKMFMEAVSNIIKTIGEANSSVARKQ